jgi:hypothetical protein
VQQTQSRTGREAERPRRALKKPHRERASSSESYAEIPYFFLFMICAFVILPVFLAVVLHFLLRF